MPQRERTDRRTLLRQQFVDTVRYARAIVKILASTPSVEHTSGYPKRGECAMYRPTGTLSRLHHDVHHRHLGFRRDSRQIVQSQIFFFSSRFSAVISAMTARSGRS